MAVRVRVQQAWYERDKVEADQDAVYLFGDNYMQQGKPIVPKSTQAVIRGLPNAIGIPTKHSPYGHDSAYLRDGDFKKFKASTLAAINEALSSGKVIVIPADGIGTGAAQLARWSPKCASFLSGALNTLAMVGRYKGS